MRLLAWIALAPWLLTACPGGEGPPILPDPPVVNVTVPQASVIGQGIHVMVSVSGCDVVSKMEILDDALLIKTFPLSANPVDLYLAANEIPYRNGIAAQPMFVAKAYCNDGRVGRSAPQAAKFLPAEAVVQAPGGAQTVPDAFIAQGSGAGVEFIGCAADGTGRRGLVAVGLDGNVTRENWSLPFPCTAGLTFFDLHPATNRRWAMEPGVGVMELERDLTVRTSMAGNVAAMGVGPDGDAIVYVSQIIGNGGGVFRLPTGGGAMNYTQAKWQFPTGSQGLSPVISNVTVDRSLVVTFATWDTSGTYPIIGIQKVDYRDGSATAYYPMRAIPCAGGCDPPQTRLNASGTVLYFPQSFSPGISRVVACATNTPNCGGYNADGQPSGLIWESEQLTGDVVLAQPYANDSRIAAIAWTHAWFLSSYDGKITNNGFTAILPQTAAVQFTGYQEGRARDIYVLTGAPGGTSTEIIGLASAEDGELFRYSIPNGSLTVAVDEDGRTWLRVGTALIKLYRLVEYQLARG